MARVLLVEDEQQLCELIAKWLTREMHTVKISRDGNEALRIIESDSFDVIILDVMLPGVDGFAVCKSFRSRGGTTPILMLTAKRTIEAKERGLDIGADDYMTKPFKLRELSARVRALSRRQPVLVPMVMRIGELTLDSAKNRVFLGEEEVRLVPKEFRLLQLLMKNAGNVVSSDDVISMLWGDESDVSPQTIRSYVRLLRQKIDAAGADSFIETIHGVGYRFVGDVQ